MEHPRIVGIVRVSQHRDGAVSPEEQRERILAEARRLDGRVVAIHDELDVSGGTPLERRKGMRQAVELVEDRQADIVVAAYFDRLFRSLSVQAEVVERVEAAGGQVLALDAGVITNGAPAQWITGTMLGVVSEYYRRSVKQRAGEAQRIAVAAGKLPFPKLPPGIVRNPDGTGRPTDDPELARTVREAFELRAGTATLADVRAFLAGRGVDISYRSVSTMMLSALYIGEIRFGRLYNPEALDALVDPDVWRRVQARHRSRGRTSPSERILARLGVLRCASCRAGLVVNYRKAGGRKGPLFPTYRCSSQDCGRRVSIGAERVETFVISAVKDRVREVQGHASAEAQALEAQARADVAQVRVDRLVRAFAAAGLDGEASAVAELEQAREDRDELRDVADRLMRSASALTVSVDDWDDLSLSARRDIIVDAVDVALVSPGNGSVEDRVKVRFVGDALGQ